MKWGRAWASPAALGRGEGWKAGKELWAPGVSRQPCEKIPCRGAISQKETGEQWVKGVGEQQESPMSSRLDVRGAACLRGLSHPVAQQGHPGGNLRQQC